MRQRLPTLPHRLTHVSPKRAGDPARRSVQQPHVSALHDCFSHRHPHRCRRTASPLYAHRHAFALGAGPGTDWPVWRGHLHDRAAVLAAAAQALQLAQVGGGHHPRALGAAPAVARHATHGLLYTLFFAVPLIGWAYSSAAGFPIVFLGLWQLPDFVPVSKELAEAIKPWHQYTAFAMAGLVLLHIAGGVKHQIVDRDGLIARMLPGR